MGGYLVLACIINFCRHKSFEQPGQPLAQHIFDAASFAMSIALLAGVYEEKVLKLIGNLSMFLIICGLAGVMYALRALFR
jgi:hypothetical protein